MRLSRDGDVGVEMLERAQARYFRAGLCDCINSVLQDCVICMQVPECAVCTFSLNFMELVIFCNTILGFWRKWQWGHRNYSLRPCVSCTGLYILTTWYIHHVIGGVLWILCLYYVASHICTNPWLQCLQQWMDVKLECPTCRQQLPDSLSEND